MGGLSTYGICDFALSWAIDQGAADGLDLSGPAVVLARSYSDDERDSPWRVVLYVDDCADAAQHDALTDVFLGRAGGTTFRNFAHAIGGVYAVRRAHIELDHTPSRERMRAGGFVSAAAASPVAIGTPVSCGIPGHDHPGQEVIADLFSVNDAPLQWTVRGRCGFATQFSYSSDS